MKEVYGKKRGRVASAANALWVCGGPAALS